jgi:hypothetical protein
VDNEFELFVNGQRVTKGEGWTKPFGVDLKTKLHPGRNIIAVRAVNNTNVASPAGFWFHLDVNADLPAKDFRPIRLTSDAKWKWTASAASTTAPTTVATTTTATTQAASAPDWAAMKFDDSKWQPAVVLGDASMKPWDLITYLPDAAATETAVETRSSMCYADPMTTALGRPSREQVNTVRPTVATTLQMLELTNGSTLAQMLERGAKKIAMTKDIRAEDAIADLFARSLGRAPTPEELASAKEIIGANVKDDGVEDLLWCVVMLPEFQLIR